MNHVPGHIVLQHPVLHFLENITLQEVQTGQVHRHRHHRTALGHAAGKIFAYLPDDFQIQLMNLPALFQGGNEIRRLKEPLLRILPPGQSLHTAESAGHSAHDGLVIGLDVSLFHCFIHMTGYIILKLHLPVQSRRVVSHEPVAAVMDAVAGNLDPGHRQIGVCAPAAQLVNACLAVHLGGRAKSQDAAVGLPDFILHAGAVCQHHEMIHIKAGNEIPWKDLFQAVSDLTKKSVPLRYAVGHIEKLEMDNVKK